MISRVLVLLTFITLVKCELVVGRGRTGVVSKIYGASPAGINIAGNYENDGSFPFMIGLERKGKLECGATLIKRYAVLTAAHCVHGFRRKDLFLRAGTFQRKGLGQNVQTSEVSFYIMHEEYNRASQLDKDLAIIFLKTPFTPDKYVNIINMASISQRDRLAKKTLTILGWGRTESKRNSDTLLKASIEVMAHENCKQKMKAFITVTDSIICVRGKNKDTGMGSGDSGGPLFGVDVDGSKILLGIASFHNVFKDTGDTDPKYPSIYVDIAKLKSWVKDTIKKESKPCPL